jgi:hypothetical protein
MLSKAIASRNEPSSSATFPITSGGLLSVGVRF